jgi:hypothetical protein
MLRYVFTEAIMGKASRGKKNRTPAPYRGESFWSYLPDGSTLLFVIGVFVFSYGTAAMQYSRWNHAENAHVHPAFHLWAVVLGLALIGVSLKSKRRT